MMLGFAFACVGTDEVTGGLRLTFGTETLLTGFHFLIAVIGLFGIGEILVTIEKGLHFEGRSAKINPFVVWQTWKKLPQYWVTIIRGTAVGIWLGVTPGGATPGLVHELRPGQALLEERRTSSAPAMLEGVVAPETAAHAAGTSALLPMLTLGIPGLAHRRGAARRPADLGPAAGTAAVRRAEGLRLGPDRLDLSRQPGGPDRRAVDGAVLGLDHAHPVLDHRAASSSWSAPSAPTRCRTRRPT